MTDWEKKRLCKVSEFNGLFKKIRVDLFLCIVCWLDVEMWVWLSNGAGFKWTHQRERSLSFFTRRSSYDILIKYYKDKRLKNEVYPDALNISCQLLAY